MNRETKLQNVFGTVILATVPKPVFQSMVKIPPEILMPRMLPEVKPKIHILDPLIFIFNEKRLLAGGLQFNFEFRREMIDVTDCGLCHPSRGGELTGRGEWRECIPGPMSYSINTENLRFIDSDAANEMLFSEGRLGMIFCNRDLRCFEEIRPERLEMSVGRVENGPFFNARFVGSGAVTIQTNDNNQGNQEQIRSAEREEISGRRNLSLPCH